MDTRRKIKERLTRGWMVATLGILLLLPLAIGTGLTVESLPVLKQYTLRHLLGSADWSPMAGKFGMLAFISGSCWVTVVAFVLSAPVCLLSAIYLTQYTKPWLLKSMNIIIDLLAGIPSVVYGVWGVLVIVPFAGNFLAPLTGHFSTGYCILSGGIVLAVMSIPYMLNMMIEVFRVIPIELKEASLSLGATNWETIKHVLLRQGFPGIAASFSLGISKALGETMAVLMVVGNVPRIAENVFQPGYPIPALLANNYGEMMSSPLYAAALMLSALILFCVIFIFNALANLIIDQKQVA